MSRQEQIRKEVLLQLYASRPVPLSNERISRDARKQGYDFSRAEIARETEFLVDEGLAAVVQLRGSVERLFRISGDGVREYEQTFAL
jgi:hypothetical protein